MLINHFPCIVYPLLLIRKLRYDRIDCALHVGLGVLLFKAPVGQGPEEVIPDVGFSYYNLAWNKFLILIITSLNMNYAKMIPFILFANLSILGPVMSSLLVGMGPLTPTSFPIPFEPLFLDDIVKINSIFDEFFNFSAFCITFQGCFTQKCISQETKLELTTSIQPQFIYQLSSD